MPDLKLFLLGPPRLELEGRSREIKRRKALALLIYLAVSGKPQHRDGLGALLWPDSNQSSARKALSRHLSELNKTLGGEGLRAEGETVGLPRSPAIWLDVEQFQQYLTACPEVGPECLDPLSEAVALYGDDFLAGFTLPNCPDFDEWQFFQSEELRGQLATALERLIQIHSAQGSYEAALPHARRRLALDPLHEPAQRQLMQLYAQSGQKAAALRQYQLCVEALEDELGLPPAEETTALYEQIRTGQVRPEAKINQPPDPSSSPARVIAHRFEIEDLEADRLGQGGMGAVYRGTDTQTGTTVVIKALKSHLADASPELVERFTREGEALRRLNHPNIVKMVTAVEEEGQHYLVMEYFAGGSLRELLDQAEPLPLDQVLAIALDLADALTRAHRLNIIHRDLKPGNVLLAGDGSPRLTDFGVAHVSQAERVTETGLVIGTIDYLSPEALSGQAIDARCDIWSFGVLLFEMLAGRRPFGGETITAIMLAITTQPPPDLARLRPDLPPALIDLVGRMLAEDPEARIPSVRLVGAVLEAIMAGRGAEMQRGKEEIETPLPLYPPAPRHNVPPQPTPFIGREAELAALDDLIANPEIRLVTIVGPGGMGKTRLALAAAERQLVQPPSNSPQRGEDNIASPPVGGTEGGRFPNGVYFVSLAPLSSTEHIIPTMAEALAFQLETGGQQKRSPQQQILDYLRQKQMLLVLDNFEHLLDGVEIVADILGAAPEVQILVTSRERLHLHEEQIFAIQGLGFPDWETPEDAAEYTAVKLFIQSVRRIQHDFELTAGDPTYLTHICRLVEGMPLGIELAASWVDTLSLADIAAEIQHSLDLLETDVRNVPERHRSIRAVFDYSWQRMSETEREIFAQLSIFRGGFTRQAAQKITSASLRMLGTLTSKSHLQFDKTRNRYQIHELLRQYGAEKLAENSEDEAAVHDRHSAYYTEMLHQRETALKSAEQLTALAEIEADIENMRTAWDWAIEQGRVERIEQALESFSRFYEWYGWYQEGEAAFRTAANLLTTVDQPRILARVLTKQVNFSRVLGNTAGAEPLLRQSQRLLDNPRLANQDTRSERAAIWLGLAGLDTDAGQHREARQWYELSRALYQEVDDRWGTARVLLEIAFLSRNFNDVTNAQEYWNQLEKTKQYVRASLAIFRELGDRAGIAGGLYQLGATFLFLGQYDEAQTAFKESVAIYEKLGLKSGLVLATAHLASANDILGLHEQAVVEGRFALNLARDIAYPDGIHMGLGRAIWDAMRRGDYNEAQQLARENIALNQMRGEQHALAYSLVFLGFASRGLGNTVQARQQLVKALEIATGTRTAGPLFFCLSLATYLLADEGKYERVAELDALLSAYPLSTSRMMDRQFIMAAIAALPANVAAAAQERGRNLDLRTTALALLEEFSQNVSTYEI